VIGRFKDGGYLLDGRFHEIPKHGFARDMDFSLVNSSESSATFRLTNSDATIAAYPYAFALEVAFTLDERTLAVDYRVTNRNDRTMFFALGSHPAFSLPANLGPLEDWSIKFDEVEAPVCHRVAENLLSSAPEPYEFDSANAIVLSDETFVRDALIFKGIRSRHLQIVHREHGVRVQFETGGAPTLGIWAKPGAPYVCLEPWFGFDDSSEINADIRQKPDMFQLAAGETFATGYHVTV
jgi:galactose mutarotase-like enzyme